MNDARRTTTARASAGSSTSRKGSPSSRRPSPSSSWPSCWRVAFPTVPLFFGEQTSIQNTFGAVDQLVLASETVTRFVHEAVDDSPGGLASPFVSANANAVTFTANTGIAGVPEEVVVQVTNGAGGTRTFGMSLYPAATQQLPARRGGMHLRRRGQQHGAHQLPHERDGREPGLLLPAARGRVVRGTATGRGADDLGFGAHQRKQLHERERERADLGRVSWVTPSSSGSGPDCADPDRHRGGGGRGRDQGHHGEQLHRQLGRIRYDHGRLRQRVGPGPGDTVPTTLSRDASSGSGQLCP